jgi:hypothetical protein
MPDWLAGLPEVGEAEAAELEVAEEVEAEAEEELEMPDWLAGPREVGEVEVTEVEVTEEVEAEVEEELEIPDWLAGLPEVGEAEAAEVEEVEAEAEEELETPVAVQTDVAEDTETEEDLVIPAWLTGLRSVSEQPAAQAEAAEVESETEMPAWLAGIPEIGEEPVAVQAGLAEVEAETEQPDWLAELPDASQETAAVQPEIIEPETEEELEMPDWLTGLPEVGEAEAVEVETGEIEEELEKPDWLADLPVVGREELATRQAEAVQDEAEEEFAIPPWLAGLSEVGEEAATAEADTVGLEDEEEIETPRWLADLDIGQEPATAEEAASIETEAEEDLVIPTWLTGLRGAGEQSVTVEAEEDEFEAETEEEVETPPWLAGEIDVEAPEWLGDVGQAPAVVSHVETAAAETEAELEASDQVTAASEGGAPDLLAAAGEEAAPVEATEVAESEASEIEEELEIPSWLFGTPLEAIETPDWLVDESEAGQKAGEAVKVTASLSEESFSVEEQPLELDQEPEAPDWLADTAEPASDDLSRPEVAAPAEAKEPPSKMLAGMAAGLSVLEGLKPGAKTPVEEDIKPAESTGMLAGLTNLLPAEKISVSRPEIATSGSDLQEAAQQFLAIATHIPQPATLPAPLTGREKVVGGAIRGLLYLLFILLVALPLFSGARIVNGSETAWTEPTGQWSEVLDSQRRQMISEQLGIVDAQQPGSVALVSFDYTLATEGEMRPLAEAVLGRLLGQGMRVIAISLEPEGAAVAQKTLDDVLGKRAENYGVNVVNLGYFPGQVVAIRDLATAAKQLNTIADYKDQVTLADSSRVDWNDIENLNQVDLVVTLADNPATARGWVEQLAAAPPSGDKERYLLAATSAAAAPFLQPYRQDEDDDPPLDGLISGINGAAAVEAVRNNFGPARQMLDSQSIAHLIIVILIAVGTMVGWMPPAETASPAARKKDG